jgi:hypothetical protein
MFVPRVNIQKRQLRLPHSKRATPVTFQQQLTAHPFPLTGNSASLTARSVS